MPTPALSEAKRAKVVKLLRTTDLTFLKIAKRCGVSTGTVSRINTLDQIRKARKERTAVKTEQILDELAAGTPINTIKTKLKVAHQTIRQSVQPNGDPETEIRLPESYQRQYQPFVINKPGRYLILSDVHVPAHSTESIILTFRYAKKLGVTGVIINGDFLDSHELSDHDKDPSAPRYREEVGTGVKFLTTLRETFPHADITYKLGNHEERLDRYLLPRAPAIFDLQICTIRGLLTLDNLGIAEVKDKRVIHLGKLHVIHGHEYKGGGGVNPARWLYLKARSRAFCGHFHRTSEHHARDIGQKFEATWSSGCLCDLHPAYAPLNEWNHGFAIVEVFNDGTFAVENKRIVEGRVI